MSCEKYLILIDDLIDGELPEISAGRLDRHLLICPECTRAYAERKQEHELYARYLFAAEPPADLWESLQAKLAPAETVETAPTPALRAAAPFWKTNIFAAFRFYPAAIAGAALIMILGLSWLKIVPEKPAVIGRRETPATASDTATTNLQSVPPAPEIVALSPAGAVKPHGARDSAAAPKITKIQRRVSVPAQKMFSETAAQSAPPKLSQGDGQAVAVKEKSSAPISALPSEAQQRQLQLRALEKQTARQIEKTELLLRSFRNARTLDGAAVYDVGYEKQQARRLLEKNVTLRQLAENYGTAGPQEILERVEPFLLDIANLGSNPVPEKILDIKERVKNQNIIASLQGY